MEIGKFGIVIKSTGSNYLVRDDNKNIVSCRLKGKLKLNESFFTNPIAVGDRVVLGGDESKNEIQIKEILPRNNYIIRKATNLSRQSHILAANIDQALLLVTLVFPKTSNGFIDRFILNAESFHIPVVLVFNKCDLYTEIENKQYEELFNIYSKLGYTCYKISVLNKIGLDKIKNILSANYQLPSKAHQLPPASCQLPTSISLLAGHSGTGKSTLLNVLNNSFNLKTANVSDFSSKGIHTTTFAEMHEIFPDSYVIDTPGIKEFGIIDIDKQEISHYFKEMRDRLQNCKFHDCLHLNEPGCAILEAVQKVDISEKRYMSYLSIVEGLDNRK